MDVGRLEDVNFTKPPNQTAIADSPVRAWQMGRRFMMGHQAGEKQEAAKPKANALIAIVVAILCLTHTHLGDSLVTFRNPFLSSSVAEWAGSSLAANGVLIGNLVVGISVVGLLFQFRSSLFKNSGRAAIWILAAVFLMAYWLWVILRF